MRIGILYGVLTAGGCERRLGELAKTLLDQGDEVFILAARMDDLGATMVTGQCGVPLQRLRLMPPGGDWEAWTLENVNTLELDVLDVQWHLQPMPRPTQFNCATVMTIHNPFVPLPSEKFGHKAMIGIVRHAGAESAAYPYHIIANWVDVEQFPFREELGEGVAAVGSWYKMANMRMYAPLYDARIDAYGSLPCGLPEKMPDNIVWHGWGDSREILPKYRVVFASGLTGIETMACGSWLLGGEADCHPGWVQDSRIVRPHRAADMAQMLFSFRGRIGQVEPPDAQSIAGEVTWALQNDAPEERRALRRMIEEHFERRTQVAKVRAVYEEVLA